MTRAEKAKQMISPKWKLTPKQRKEMVAAYVAGEPANSIAKRFGVTLQNVRYHARAADAWAGRRPAPVEARFWSKVSKGAACWEWRGALFPNGYGCFSLDGQSIGAHRFSYELAFGPIPSTLCLDHLCRNKKCVNPAHLEAVTVVENVRRGYAAKGKKYVLKKA